MRRVKRAARSMERGMSASRMEVSGATGAILRRRRRSRKPSRFRQIWRQTCKKNAASGRTIGVWRLGLRPGNWIGRITVWDKDDVLIAGTDTRQGGRL